MHQIVHSYEQKLNDTELSKISTGFKGEKRAIINTKEYRNRHSREVGDNVLDNLTF